MKQRKLEIIKEKIWNCLTKNLSYEAYVWFTSKYEYWREKDKEALWGHPFFISKKGKEKYVILRNKYPNDGLFCVANQYLFMYQWAKERGYIPLMDWESIYNYKERKIGEYNLWEICFDNLVSVKEAVKKDWVLVEAVGVGDKISEKMCMKLNGVEDDSALHLKKENWREYYKVAHDYAKECWTIKSVLQNDFETKYADYFECGSVLGISLREEFSVDAMKLRGSKEAIELYQNHPLVPGIKDIIERVKECNRVWKCKYIFVATMCLDSIEAFKREFGDQVIYIERERKTLEDILKATDGDGFFLKWDKEETAKQATSESTRNGYIGYVNEILGLSKCDYLIASSCSASIAAMVMNGGVYKEREILPDLHHICRY